MCVDFVFLWWMECVVGGGVLLLLLLLLDLAVGEDGERTTKRGDLYACVLVRCGGHLFMRRAVGLTVNKGATLK
jgi:hypothetical protein